jgi:hypothetical protein
MSDLLQRLVERSRGPLAPLQPILPSIHAPSRDGGPWEGDRPRGLPAVSAPEPEVSFGQPAASPDRRADSREPIDPPAPADERAPERTSVPSPATREETIRPASESKASSQRRKKEADPAPVAEKPSAAMPTDAVRKPVAEVSAFPPVGKLRPGEAFPAAPPSAVKTEIPGSLLSRAVHRTGRKVQFAAPESVPGDRDARAPAGKKAALATAVAQEPPTTRTEIPAGLFAKASARLGKMTSRALSARGAEPASQVEERARLPRPAAEPASSRGERVPAARQPPVEGAGDASGAESGAGARPEDGERGMVTVPAGQPVSGRRADASSRNPPRGGEAVPSVEVHVSIGHIEVRAVQAKAPAPRRKAYRPRVSLGDFLSRPHYGGPA